MTITFFSNYLNHHQLSFCNEMIKLIGNDFKFVATGVISNERIKLGYDDMNNKYDFVIRAYEKPDEAYKLGNESDVVIIGSSPQKYIKQRLKKGKITFRYSERLFKNKKTFIKCIPLLSKIALFEKKNTYLLCASAYASNDYNKLKLFKNKTYKWGYFPNVKKYDSISNLLSQKENNSILWVGRFIDWKHPEVVVKIAEIMKKENSDFIIRMIGIGDMYNKIENLINSKGLNKNIFLLGAMTPEKVREYMEISKVFLFTSDKGEGWGAVLNEAMNSGCAVIANKDIGSVPFLIEDGKNGFIFSDKDYDALSKKIMKLFNDNKLINKIGYNAYYTIINEWNPQIAAKRFLELSTTLEKNNTCDKYSDGPCSKCN